MSTNISKAAHSKLGASSYYRCGKSLGGCPGSVKACEGIVSESSVYAEEGTLAHEIAAHALLNPGKDFVTKEIIPGDMLEAVNVYYDYIGDLRTQHDDSEFIEFIEQKFNLSAYHPDLFGTADYVCYYPKSKTLHVVDYKHGQGISVEVENSPQLMYYGLGALHTNKFPIEKIVLTIAQPRCFHKDGGIRSWETTPGTMLEFVADLIDDAKATEDPNAPLNPGDHCHFCPAKPTCPALQVQALSVITDAFTEVVAFDGDKVAEKLKLIPRIKAWCEGFTEYAYQQAMLGNVPTGYKLVDKRATRKWKENVTAENIWADFGLKMNDINETSIKSPAAIEKLLPKKEKKLLEKYTVKISSGKTLALAADDRDSVKGTIEGAFNEE